MKIHRKTVKVIRGKIDEAVLKAINLIVKNTGIKLLDHTRSKKKVTVYYTKI